MSFSIATVLLLLFIQSTMCQNGSSNGAQSGGAPTTCKCEALNRCVEDEDELTRSKTKNCAAGCIRSHFKTATQDQSKIFSLCLDDYEDSRREALSLLTKCLGTYCEATTSVPPTPPSTNGNGGGQTTPASNGGSAQADFLDYRKYGSGGQYRSSPEWNDILGAVHSFHHDAKHLHKQQQLPSSVWHHVVQRLPAGHKIRTNTERADALKLLSRFRAKRESGCPLLNNRVNITSGMGLQQTYDCHIRCRNSLIIRGQPAGHKCMQKLSCTPAQNAVGASGKSPNECAFELAERLKRYNQRLVQCVQLNFGQNITIVDEFQRPFQPNFNFPFARA